MTPDPSVARRSFLGGLLSGLAALLGGKAKATATSLPSSLHIGEIAAPLRRIIRNEPLGPDALMLDPPLTPPSSRIHTAHFDSFAEPAVPVVVYVNFQADIAFVEFVGRRINLPFASFWVVNARTGRRIYEETGHKIIWADATLGLYAHMGGWSGEAGRLREVHVESAEIRFEQRNPRLDLARICEDIQKAGPLGVWNCHGPVGQHVSQKLIDKSIRDVHNGWWL